MSGLNVRVSREDFSNIKVGDRVVVATRLTKVETLTVTHTTRTQIHVGLDKFRRGDGRRMGEGDWCFDWKRLHLEGWTIPEAPR